MKARHEQQVKQNQQYPQLMGELTRLVSKYQPAEDSLAVSISDVVEDPARKKTVHVEASKEGGINTGINLSLGQRVAFFVRGLISFDSGHHFATPEGVLCNEYGMPLSFKDESGSSSHAMLVHPEAYRTDGDQMGRVGSMIGWINSYSETSAFLIGAKKEIEVAEEGCLFLANTMQREPMMTMMAISGWIW